MNVVCVICSDLLTPSDDVCSTHCGHIFHFVCLTQWLERSKTCPQCREKTTNAKIHRVYFNFSNNDTVTDDTSSLLDRIDKLNFQLLLRDKDNKHYTEKNETLEKQNAGLRKQVRQVESELNEKNSAIHALKEQTKYFKVQCAEVESTKKEIERLKNKVEEYKNIQTVLEGTAEDVDEMITRGCDAATLITYISVMKREMTTSFQKRRELRNRFKSLQQELTKVSMERNFLSEEHEKRKKLEESLMVCESEKMSLQNELRELRTNAERMKKLVKSTVKHVNSEVAKIDSVNRKESETLGDDNKLEEKETCGKGKPDPIIVISDGDEKSSPYLPVKTMGVYSFNQPSMSARPPAKRVSSILFKKPRIGQTNATHKETEADTMTYNGLGGHSRHDTFPVPVSSVKARKLKDDATKSKKQKLDTDNNQKLDFLMNIT